MWLEADIEGSKHFCCFIFYIQDTCCRIDPVLLSKIDVEDVEDSFLLTGVCFILVQSKGIQHNIISLFHMLPHGFY